MPGIVFTHTDKVVVVAVLVGAIVMLLAAWVDSHRNKKLYELPEDWSEVKEYGGKGER